MIIKDVIAQEAGVLRVVSEDGRSGTFDVRPYMESDAFRALKDPAAFERVRNGKYFVAWLSGADLSADTIEARWQVESNDAICAVAESCVDYATGESEKD